MIEKRHLVRCFEAVLLVAIIITIWLVVFLPVAVYFLVSSRVIL